MAGAKARLGEPQNRVFPKYGRFSQRVYSSVTNQTTPINSMPGSGRVFQSLIQVSRNPFASDTRLEGRDFVIPLQGRHRRAGVSAAVLD